MFLSGLFIAVILFSYTSLKMGSSKASLFIILVPISGIIFSVIFLHERINLLTTAAMFYYDTGIFYRIVIPSKKKRSQNITMISFEIEFVIYGK